MSSENLGTLGYTPVNPSLTIKVGFNGGLNYIGVLA